MDPWIHADSYPGQALKSQKVQFLHKNFLKVGERSKTQYIRRNKGLLESKKTRFIC
jgi:hypothetical protein